MGSIERRTRFQEGPPWVLMFSLGMVTGETYNGWKFKPDEGRSVEVYVSIGDLLENPVGSPVSPCTKRRVHLERPWCLVRSRSHEALRPKI